MSRTKVIITKYLINMFSYVLYELGFLMKSWRMKSRRLDRPLKREKDRQGVMAATVKRIHLKNDEDEIQGKMPALLQ